MRQASPIDYGAEKGGTQKTTKEPTGIGAMRLPRRFFPARLQACGQADALPPDGQHGLAHGHSPP